MLEKLLISFIIIESFALMIHVIGETRCWLDRSYWKKHQKMVDEMEMSNLDAQKHIQKLMLQYKNQVELLVSSEADIRFRVDELEKDKLKKMMKKKEQAAKEKQQEENK